MRSGPIRPEVRTSDVDRHDVSYAMWEQTVSVSPELPWAAASSLRAQDVASLLSTCRTAVLVVGRGNSGTALLEHVLASVPSSCRLYIYGSRVLETDARIRQMLGTLSDRVLSRLGFDAPADWLVVDSGRAALLLVGPPSEERRWLIPADGPLARTLFEAFRVLFWFHAAREGLPDMEGAYAFRTPLPSPFPDPGNDVALPSGHLAIGGHLPDPVVHAEIRIATNGAVPGRAGIVFMPPDPKDFASPARLVGGMTRVVWLDTGLPRTAVSRERLVFELIEAPISLQIEWPRKDAIDLYHRLSKSAQRPAWQFYTQRRLADVAGPVLLEGAAKPAAVLDSEVLEAPDLIVPLSAFDGVQPDKLPDPPALARRVTYKWRALPATLPPGAREAELVRRWRAVDEWARRQVDTLRQALASMEGEERSWLDRLRTRLSGHDTLRQRRSRVREQLEELGETPPSRYFEGADDLVRRIIESTREVGEMLEEAHRARLEAEDSAAEAEQHAAWKARTQRAAEELAAKRLELGSLEETATTLAMALEEAENRQRAAMELHLSARRATLEEQRQRASAELDAARREGAAQAGPSKQQRKEHKRKVWEIGQRVARVSRELESLSSWSPPTAELADERGAVNRARAARDEARERARLISDDIRRLEQLASEPFVFKAPARPPGPAVPQEVAAPPIPAEAPPELGALFEHQGRRYLAVKTWDQVPRAAPVARRLQSELVSLADHNE